MLRYICALQEWLYLWKLTNFCTRAFSIYLGKLYLPWSKVIFYKLWHQMKRRFQFTIPQRTLRIYIRQNFFSSYKYLILDTWSFQIFSKGFLKNHGALCIVATKHAPGQNMLLLSLWSLPSFKLSNIKRTESSTRPK